MHHVDIYQIENIADRSDRDTLINVPLLAAALHYCEYLHTVDIIDNLDNLSYNTADTK